VNRITPDQVVEAYRKTGLKPTRSSWFGQLSHQECEACGQTAVAVAEGNVTIDDLKKVNNLTIEEFEDGAMTTCQLCYAAAVKLTGSPDYVTGFVAGFDNCRRFPGRDNAYHDGYDDGAAAAEAVFATEGSNV
jgi:hypothetical protein